MVRIMNVQFRKSACEFLLDIMHKDGQKDNEQIWGEGTALADA